jgi:hypothetical protein
MATAWLSLHFAGVLFGMKRKKASDKAAVFAQILWKGKGREG